MPQNTLLYLFDPLCGWCYGAAPALDALTNHPSIELMLLPSGLFTGRGARPQNRQWADYAWANDQRIAALTGQVFSEAYRWPSSSMLTMRWPFWLANASMTPSA
ncbi:protein-disulfide isomerase-like protein with CxxC motif [Stenotrophomonas chelatiphaga]|uniref:hypothetical protein n=1 Tax=Stenotrophomonas chelatiphaga TaxID=517011 RepID=UPI0011CE2CEC|nr:hypothetical protein [Stenotrophomonas chelatiphaga]MCS4229363.1 protein-disulfide isomerase-like protein with CxxC motif [Stenotrophomonas chelatiphaga]